MGINMGFGFSCDRNSINPDPNDFKILSLDEVEGHSIVIVKYHDCINYKGIKLLFFKNTSNAIIKDLDTLNPHFLEEKGVFPFARFEPTEDGIRAAVALASLLKKIPKTKTCPKKFG